MKNTLKCLDARRRIFLEHVLPKSVAYLLPDSRKLIAGALERFVEDGLNLFI